MAKKKGTTVEFTEFAASCLEKLLVRDTLKNLTSSGIIAFQKLSSDDRDRAVNLANGIDIGEWDLYEERRKLQEITRLLLELRNQELHPQALQLCDQILRIADDQYQATAKLGVSETHSPLDLERNIAPDQREEDAKLKAASIVQRASNKAAKSRTASK